MTVSTEVSVLSQLRPAGVMAARCPSRIVLDHVTSRWGVLVLVALWERPRRWGELRRDVEGVSEKMLAQTLRTLERDGIVHREAASTIPPRVDYSLTARGREVAERLVPLVGWIVEHAEEILAEADAPAAPQGGRSAVE